MLSVWWSWSRLRPFKFQCFLSCSVKGMLLLEIFSTFATFDVAITLFFTIATLPRHNIDVVASVFLHSLQHRLYFRIALQFVTERFITHNTNIKTLFWKTSGWCRCLFSLFRTNTIIYNDKFKLLLTLERYAYPAMATLNSQIITTPRKHEYWKLQSIFLITAWSAINTLIKKLNLFTHHFKKKNILFQSSPATT